VSARLPLRLPAALAGPEPAYIPSGFVVLFAARIPAWLIALTVVIVHVRPEYNLRYEPALLVFTFLQIVAGLLYVPLFRRRVQEWMGIGRGSSIDLLAVSAIDMALAFTVVYLSGGFNTPYYHFLVVALLVPTFLLGWAGSLATLALFLLALVSVWSLAGPGTQVWLQRVQFGNAIPGLLLTPVLVVVVAQYLAWLGRRLDEGQHRTRQALEGTAALYRVARAIAERDETQPLVEQVAQIVGRTGRFEHVSIWQRSGDLYRCAAAWSRADGAAGSALGARATTEGGRAQDPPGMIRLQPDGVGQAELRALPLTSQDRAWGVLAIGGEERWLSGSELQFLGAVTAQLSVAFTRLALAQEREHLVAEQERARIAREIHDGIAQSIYMLTLHLDRSAEKARDDPVLGPQLARLVGVAKEALLEIRHYIFDVKPMLAGDRSLVSTLRALVKEFETVAEMPVRLEIEGSEASLPLAVGSSLCRVLQEALANALRHASASTVRVKIVFGAESAVLEVHDDGVGFDLAGGATTGHGIRNIRERVAELGGSAEFRSSSGVGTTVCVSIPLTAVAS
jgi:signal transduction histidine kinase